MAFAIHDLNTAFFSFNCTKQIESLIYFPLYVKQKQTVVNHVQLNSDSTDKDGGVFDDLSITIIGCINNKSTLLVVVTVNTKATTHTQTHTNYIYFTPKKYPQKKNLHTTIYN